jgi:hypothetical protein
MLPAGQRADAANCCIYDFQAGAVALAPDQALVICRGDLAALQRQRDARRGKCSKGAEVFS